MFTGIVKDTGRLEGIERDEQGARFEIATRLDVEDFEIGESIAVDGTCLTVTEVGEGCFRVELSPETLSRTTLGACEEGSTVHLERALAVGERLDGHVVQGHVDGVGEIVGRQEAGESIVLSIEVPSGMERWIVEKGSVAVDGVSLTVNDLAGKTFEVAIIPHTARETNLGERRPGDRVNLEADMLGKYVERLRDWEGDEGSDR